MKFRNTLQLLTSAMKHIITGLKLIAKNFNCNIINWIALNRLQCFTKSVLSALITILRLLDGILWRAILNNWINALYWWKIRCCWVICIISIIFVAKSHRRSIIKNITFTIETTFEAHEEFHKIDPIRLSSSIKWILKVDMPQDIAITNQLDEKSVHVSVTCIRNLCIIIFITIWQHNPHSKKDSISQHVINL